MNAVPSIRRCLSVLVYFAAISLGAGLLVADPTRPLLVVPVSVAVVLLVRALTTATLDELGHATMWLWVAIFALSVGGGLFESFVVGQHDVPSLAEVPAARTVGTFGLSTVLVAVYAHTVRERR
jgi:hypothetical protein